MVRESWVLALGLTWATQAGAESQPPATPPPPAAPATSTPASPGPAASADGQAPAEVAKEAPAAPDQVVLKNGNRYRGTIAELVKGEFVTIVLITGETRKIPWDQVEEAGPASEKPAKPTRDDEQDDDVEEDGQPPVPRRRPSRHVRNMDARPGSYDISFSSDRKGTRFFVRGESERAYRFLCTAPCSDWLEPQAYAVAIRIGEDDEMTYANTIAIDGPTRVLANYRDRSGVRGAGILVLTLSTAVLGLTYIYSESDHAETSAAVTFGAAGVVGVFVGVGLIAASDGVVVKASPLSQ